MSREKKAAEATWGEFEKVVVFYSYIQPLESTDMKTRFRAKSEKLKTKPVKPTTIAARSRKQGNGFHDLALLLSDLIFWCPQNIKMHLLFLCLKAHSQTRNLSLLKWKIFWTIFYPDFDFHPRSFLLPRW